MRSLDTLKVGIFADSADRAGTTAIFMPDMVRTFAHDATAEGYRL